MIRRRPFAALLAAFALVFAQVAVSAHACPASGAPASSEVKAHRGACHEMAAPDEAPITNNVCAEHCQYGDVSVDNSPPAPVAIDVGGTVLRIPSPAAATSVDTRPAWRYAPAAAAPPPAILFGVLRI